MSDSHYTSSNEPREASQYNQHQHPQIDADLTNKPHLNQAAASLEYMDIVHDLGSPSLLNRPSTVPQHIQPDDGNIPSDSRPPTTAISNVSGNMPGHATSNRVTSASTRASSGLEPMPGGSQISEFSEPPSPTISISSLNAMPVRLASSSVSETASSHSSRRPQHHQQVINIHLPTHSYSTQPNTHVHVASDAVAVETSPPASQQPLVQQQNQRGDGGQRSAGTQQGHGASFAPHSVPRDSPSNVAVRPQSTSAAVSSTVKPTTPTAPSPGPSRQPSDMPEPTGMTSSSSTTTPPSAATTSRQQQGSSTSTAQQRTASAQQPLPTSVPSQPVQQQSSGIIVSYTGQTISSTTSVSDLLSGTVTRLPLEWTIPPHLYYRPEYHFLHIYQLCRQYQRSILSIQTQIATLQQQQQPLQSQLKALNDKLPPLIDKLKALIIDQPHLQRSLQLDAVPSGTSSPNNHNPDTPGGGIDPPITPFPADRPLSPDTRGIPLNLDSTPLELLLRPVNPDPETAAAHSERARAKQVLASCSSQTAPPLEEEPTVIPSVINKPCPLCLHTKPLGHELEKKAWTQVYPSPHIRGCGASVAQQVVRQVYAMPDDVFTCENTHPSDLGLEEILSVATRALHQTGKNYKPFDAAGTGSGGGYCPEVNNRHSHHTPNDEQYFTATRDATNDHHHTASMPPPSIDLSTLQSLDPLSDAPQRSNPSQLNGVIPNSPYAATSSSQHQQQQQLAVPTTTTITGSIQTKGSSEYTGDSSYSRSQSQYTHSTTAHARSSSRGTCKSGKSGGMAVTVDALLSDASLNRSFPFSCDNVFFRKCGVLATTLAAILVEHSSVRHQQQQQYQQQTHPSRSLLISPPQSPSGTPSVGGPLSKSHATTTISSGREASQDGGSRGRHSRPSAVVDGMSSPSIHPTHDGYAPSERSDYSAHHLEPTGRPSPAFRPAGTHTHLTSPRSNRSLSLHSSVLPSPTGSGTTGVGLFPSSPHNNSSDEQYYTGSPMNTPVLTSMRSSATTPVASPISRSRTAMAHQTRPITTAGSTILVPGETDTGGDNSGDGRSYLDHTPVSPSLSSVQTLPPHTPSLSNLLTTTPSIAEQEHPQRCEYVDVNTDTAGGQQSPLSPEVVVSFRNTAADGTGNSPATATPTGALGEDGFINTYHDDDDIDSVSSDDDYYRYPSQCPLRLEDFHISIASNGAVSVRFADLSIVLPPALTTSLNLPTTQQQSSSAHAQDLSTGVNLWALNTSSNVVGIMKPNLFVYYPRAEPIDDDLYDITRLSSSGRPLVLQSGQSVVSTSSAAGSMIGLPSENYSKTGIANPNSDPSNTAQLQQQQQQQGHPYAQGNTLTPTDQLAMGGKSTQQQQQYHVTTPTHYEQTQRNHGGGVKNPATSFSRSTSTTSLAQRNGEVLPGDPQQQQQQHIAQLARDPQSPSSSTYQHYLDEQPPHQAILATPATLPPGSRTDVFPSTATTVSSSSSQQQQQQQYGSSRSVAPSTTTGSSHLTGGGTTTGLDDDAGRRSYSQQQRHRQQQHHHHHHHHHHRHRLMEPVTEHRVSCLLFPCDTAPLLARVFSYLTLKELSQISLVNKFFYACAKTALSTAHMLHLEQLWFRLGMRHTYPILDFVKHSHSVNHFSANFCNLIGDKFLITLLHNTFRTPHQRANLYQISLYYCYRLTTTSIQYIVDNFPNLRILDLGRCHSMDDRVFPLISQLQNLRKLNLSGMTEISSHFATLLLNNYFPQLIYLNVQGCSSETFSEDVLQQLEVTRPTLKIVTKRPTIPRKSSN